MIDYTEAVSKDIVNLNYIDLSVHVVFNLFFLHLLRKSGEAIGEKI